MVKSFRTFRSTGLKQSVYTIVGNFFATGLAALALILISRLLGPTEFGVFSVGFAITVILTKVIDLGVNAAIIKYVGGSQQDSERSAYLSEASKLKVTTTIVVTILGLMMAPWIADRINFPHVDIIRISFALIAGTIFYEHLLALLQSLHQFGQAIFLNVLQAGTKLLGVIIFFLLSIRSGSWLFALYIAAPFTSLLMAKTFIPQQITLNIFSSSPKAMKNILTMMKHTSIALIAAGIIENIDVLFIQRYLNTYETGLFGGVSRIAMLFAVIAYSIGNVLYPRVAKYKSQEHLQAFLKKAFMIVVASALGFLMTIPFAKWLIILTIGQAYVAATPVLLILLAASFLTIAVIPFIALFYSFNANWYFSLSGILQLVIVVLGNYLFVPIYGLEAAAWTRLASRVFLFAFTVSIGVYYYYRHYVLPSAQKH